MRQRGLEAMNPQGTRVEKVGVLEASLAETHRKAHVLTENSQSKERDCAAMARANAAACKDKVVRDKAEVAEMLPVVSLSPGYP